MRGKMEEIDWLGTNKDISPGALSQKFWFLFQAVKCVKYVLKMD